MYYVFPNWIGQKKASLFKAVSLIEGIGEGEGETVSLFILVASGRGKGGEGRGG